MWDSDWRHTTIPPNLQLFQQIFLMFLGGSGDVCGAAAGDTSAHLQCAV